MKWRPELFVLFCTFLILVAVRPQAFALENGKKRQNNTVDMIIIHAIGGPDTACPKGQLTFTPAGGPASTWKDYFAKHDTVSIHHIVDREGNLESSVPENEVAIHAGNSNARSIGIELVNNGDGKEIYKDAMITRLISLIKDIRTRFSIPLGNIKGHEEVDQSKFLCGGKEYKRKVDPGPLFPWAKVKDALK